MSLLEIVLIVILTVCMLGWFFASFGPQAMAPYPWAPHMLAWISVFVLILLVFGVASGGGGMRRVGMLVSAIGLS